MDGKNNGKPYEQMDDLGGFTTPIFGNTQQSLKTMREHDSSSLVWKKILRSRGGNGSPENGIGPLNTFCSVPKL